MNRYHPVIRALCIRLKRPATKQIVAGLLLTVPAGLATTRDAKVSAKISEMTGPIFLAPVEAIAPTTPGAKQAIAEATVYADKFDIPVKLAQNIHLAAKANGITPKTAFGLVKAESSFRTKAISPVGAVGLTQLMPATARWLRPGTTRTDLMTPETNLQLGFKYLKQLKDRYHGNEQLALTAYNRGPGTVDKMLKRGANPDNGYAEKVKTGKSKKHVALMNRKFRHKS
ncbi:MAG TPA: lytic transglycosylase domain-containing protein [Longimicrobiales bacterium]|nr:lytic transglycosylase domain-containing protein [Longimicrobiales bacterium]